MFKKTMMVLSLVALGGCVSSGFFYEASSGLRVDANPALFKRFQSEKLQCDGLAAEKALAANIKDRGLYNRNVTLVYHACMARAGYEVRDK